MRKRLGQGHVRKGLGSITFVFLLVASSMVVVFPLTAPKVKGQPIEHLASTADEDGVFPYDIDGIENQIVVWNPAEDHHITADYTVDALYTLHIPGLNYMFDPVMSSEITFKTADTMIDVYGTLITHSDGNEMTKTLFWGEDEIEWKGIYFRPGSSANITDCIFDGATSGLHMWTWIDVQPMTLLPPGITDTTFRDMGIYGVRFSHLEGATNIDGCTFEDNYNSALPLKVSGTDMTLRNTAFFSHGNGTPCLLIRNSDVTAEGCYFHGNYQPGHLVHIDDIPGSGNSNGTVFRDCDFTRGEADVPLYRVDGATPFFDNCSFDTSHGEDSVLAYEIGGKVPAHLTLRNPAGDGSPGFWDGSFDNTTMNVTGNSTITLQWYTNVNVVDPDGHPINKSFVTVSAPAEPSSKPTDGLGWAEWFTVTELVKYNDSVVYNGPYNITATNNSMEGFADPEPSFDMSKEIFIEVPFNPKPNNLPNVTFFSTPAGVHTGPIAIEFILVDMDPGDDGNMSIEVEFWDDDIGIWKQATVHATSCPTTGLDNNTLYQYVWDSQSKDFPNRESTQVKIRIRGRDRSGSWGPWNETLNFTVDNKVPELLSGPTVVTTNTTCNITWTVDEPAHAVVWYGLYGNGTFYDLTHENQNLTLDTLQSVTLTNLLPGRRYSFVINSTDGVGNTYSRKVVDTFETFVYIYLYQGWNMISVPPWLWNADVGYLWEDGLHAVLSNIAGEWDVAQWYHPRDPADPWKTNHTAKPYHMNDLHTYNCSWGLWLHMKTDRVLIPNY
ncbi:MAG: right-handed parallel beta-helix repeat-containing protein, partial [Thermoplasmata archaeon]